MYEIPRRERGIRGATILLALLLAVKAQAHTYIVTDTNDTTAVTSLRGGDIAANQRVGENTIILGEGAAQASAAAGVEVLFNDSRRE